MKQRVALKYRKLTTKLNGKCIYMSFIQIRGCGGLIKISTNYISSEPLFKNCKKAINLLIDTRLRRYTCS
jgi:hypothetical protein